MTLPADIDWDDLRVVLQIARHGRLAAAAAASQVSHATLFRRLKALEARLGVRLFERLRSGYQPTGAGIELIEVTQRVASELQAVTAGLRGRQAWPGGLVRITAADTWMQELLPPLLADYQVRHRVQISLSTGNGLVDLMQGETDVALRSGGPPPEPLVGRRLARVEATVYCSRKLGGVRVDRLKDLPWVGVDNQLQHLTSARWLEQQGLAGRVSV